MVPPLWKAEDVTRVLQNHTRCSADCIECLEPRDELEWVQHVETRGGVGSAVAPAWHLLQPREDGMGKGVTHCKRERALRSKCSVKQSSRAGTLKMLHGTRLAYKAVYVHCWGAGPALQRGAARRSALCPARHIKRTPHLWHVC